MRDLRSAFKRLDLSAWSISNGTTDRAFDANATSLDELADALFTLIQDIKGAGVAGTITDPTTTRGDVIVRGASALQRLALAAANDLYSSDGTDLVSKTLSAILDAKIGSTRGMTLARGASTWGSIELTKNGQVIAFNGVDLIAALLSASNQISNGEFTSWSAGTSAMPDKWSLVGTTTHSQQSKLSGQVRGFAYRTAPGAVNSGISFSFSCKGGTAYSFRWIHKVNTSGTSRFRINDGTTTTDTDGTDTTATEKTVTITTAVGATTITVSLLHAEASNSSDFGGIQCNEGNVPLPYAQHPNDEQLKAIEYKEQLIAGTTGYSFGCLRAELVRVQKAAPANVTSSMTATFQTAFAKILLCVANHTGGWAARINVGTESWTVSNCLVQWYTVDGSNLSALCTNLDAVVFAIGVA